jgi:hypothetical protein
MKSIAMSMSAFQKLYECKPGVGGIMGGTKGLILAVECDTAIGAQNFGTYKPNFNYWKDIIDEWKIYGFKLMVA